MEALSEPAAKRRMVLAERPMRGLEVVLAQVGDTMGPDLIVAALRGPVSEALLREACWRVQQKHPSLRAAIRWPQGRAQAPWLQVFAADRDALDVVVVEPADAGPQPWRRTHSAHWEWVAEEQSKHRFDLDAGFLFRVVWVPDSSGDTGHLIICSHHAVVDGTSLMRLVNQVLHEMSAVHQILTGSGALHARAAARLRPVEPMPLSASLYSHLRFGWLDKVLTWVGRWQFAREQKQFTTAPWLPIAAPGAGNPLQVHTQCIFRRGQPGAWQELSTQCKQRGVTVGGAFSASVQFAVARYLTEHGMPVPMRGRHVAMPLSMDYNMRGRVDHGQIDGEAIGLGTSIASIGVKVSPEIGFWPLARQLMESARQQVKLGIPKLFQAVTDTVTDYREFIDHWGLDHRRSGGAGDGINISNVGRYPFAERVGSFAIEDVFGFNGACVGGPLFIFWLRQVDGHLCYNAMACSPAVDRQRLAQVFEHVVELMEGLAPTARSDDLTLAAYSRMRPAQALTMPAPATADVLAAAWPREL